jgi:hypothetical protein
LNRNILLNGLVQTITFLAILSGHHFWHIVFLLSLSFIVHNLITGQKPVEPREINSNLVDNYLEGATNKIVKDKMDKLPSMGSKKVIKIDEAGSNKTEERNNVCKWMTSWIYK